jgi:hypothetical protein
MQKMQKSKNKFLNADCNAYLETEVVVSYICFLTTWFKKVVQNSEIPYIKDAKNKKLFKKADVLKWVQENRPEITPKNKS